MRIVVANLSAHYTGRGDTKLALYNRIVIHKEDGSVSIHSEKGFKPLNYMTQTASFTDTEDDEGNLMWIFTNKQERLEIVFHEIFDEINLPLGTNDPGHSSRDGTEAQLQDWLVLNLKKLAPEYDYSGKEYQTGDGPVDLVADHIDGHFVAIEVKRVAPMNTVGQIQRYVNALQDRFPERSIKGAIAAVEFKDKTRELAHRHNIELIEIPANWLDVGEKDTIVKEPIARTLFD